MDCRVKPGNDSGEAVADGRVFTREDGASRLLPGNDSGEVVADGGDIGVLKHAVLRTAMPGHDK
jgi:hypothetical protein